MIAFCHIPKTAGTTLNYLLRRYYGTSIYAVQTKKNALYSLADLKKEKRLLGKPKCISGHQLKPFSFDLDDVNWFTFLRDPGKRYISQYIHQQTNNYDLHKLPIFDWAKRFKRSNWQTKWLAGEEDLEAAKQIIKEKFKYIGLVEHFDESLLLMKKGLGMEGADLRYGTSLMTSRNLSLQNEFKENYEKYKSLIEEENAIDYQLYDYVKNHIFESQRSNYGLENLNEDLKSFETSRIDYVNSRSWKYLKFKLQHNLIYKPYKRFF